jgi:hypothetical protein
MLLGEISRGFLKGSFESSRASSLRYPRSLLPPAVEKTALGNLRSQIRIAILANDQAVARTENELNVTRL